MENARKIKKLNYNRFTAALNMMNKIFYPCIPVFVPPAYYSPTYTFIIFSNKKGEFLRVRDVPDM